MITLIKIKYEIYKKSISLEHFWRCLVFYFEQENFSFLQFNEGDFKNMISQSMNDILRNGDCYELIDGENLEYKGDIISKVLN